MSVKKHPPLFRVLCIIMCVAVVLTASAFITYAIENRYYGDIDASGDVTTDDARLALRMAVGLLPQPVGEDLLCGDINSNSDIDTNDARYILRMAVGLEPKDRMNSEFTPSADALLEKIANARTIAEAEPLTENKELSKTAKMLAKEFYLSGDERYMSNGDYWFTAVTKADIGAVYGDMCYYCGSGVSGAAYDAIAADYIAGQMIKSTMYNTVGAGCYAADDGMFYWCVIVVSI